MWLQRGFDDEQVGASPARAGPPPQEVRLRAGREIQEDQPPSLPPCQAKPHQVRRGQCGPARLTGRGEVRNSTYFGGFILGEL